MHCYIQVTLVSLSLTSQNRWLHWVCLRVNGSATALTKPYNLNNILARFHNQNIVLRLIIRCYMLSRVTCLLFTRYRYPVVTDGSSDAVCSYDRSQIAVCFSLGLNHKTFFLFSADSGAYKRGAIWIFDTFFEHLKGWSCSSEYCISIMLFSLSGSWTHRSRYFWGLLHCTVHLNFSLYTTLLIDYSRLK